MRNASTRYLLVALLAALCTASASGQGPSEQAVLLDGVEQIAGPCCSGQLLVFGGEAFPVVFGGEHQYLVPVVAAVHVGKGRAVAFAHSGYFAKDFLSSQDGGRLLLNALTWAAGRAPKEGAIRAGVRGAPDLAAYLAERGVEVTALEGELQPELLPRLDAVCCAPSSLTASEVDCLSSYLRQGGGLLACEKAQSWLDAQPARNIADYPGNQLTAAYGLMWTSGDLGRPEGERCFARAPDSGKLAGAEAALEALVSHVRGGAKLGKEDLGQAVFTVTRFAVTAPPGERVLLPKLRTLLRGYRADFSHICEQPLTMDYPLGRLLLAVQVQALSQSPPHNTPAHPAAVSFPGPVPSGAPRLTTALTVDTAISGWHSTGLYAAPGECVTLAVPEAAAGKGLALRIGAHSDSLWHLERWERAPEIARTFPVTTTRTLGANAFGGPIYIDVPEKSRLGKLEVTIANAVQAPHFVLGRTDPVQWRQDLRHRPAPWAEMETSKVILTVPSSAIRSLDDPVPVMEFWVHVLDSCNELLSRPLERTRPERIVCDQQISDGYMHSGYPIMTLLDVAPLVVDVQKLKSQGSWGHFHEIGHNHQSSDWTFDGTDEVTENLFSLYILDKVCGITHAGHPNVVPEAVQRFITGYFAAPDFEKWKASPFLGLVMYEQLQQAFGWEPFKRVFAEYNSLPNSERANTDDQKRDQWMVRFSRAIGRNLGPFFETWRIPTSEAARQSIADLPAWMPEGFPPQPPASSP